MISGKYMPSSDGKDSKADHAAEDNSNLLSSATLSEIKGDEPFHSFDLKFFLKYRLILASS